MEKLFIFPFVLLGFFKKIGFYFFIDNQCRSLEFRPLVVYLTQNKPYKRNSRSATQGIQALTDTLLSNQNISKSTFFQCYYASVFRIVDMTIITKGSPIIHHQVTFSVNMFKMISTKEKQFRFFLFCLCHMRVYFCNKPSSGKTSKSKTRGSNIFGDKMEQGPNLI